MRVISVRQPWAGSIVHHGKDVENRSRNIAGSYRGLVAIHVSQRHDYDAQNGPHHDVMGGIDQHNIYGWGHVIGVVDLGSVHHCSDHGRNEADRCSRWAMPDHWHLCLSGARALAAPVPARGRLGLWTPDDDLAAAIRAQLHDNEMEEA